MTEHKPITKREPGNHSPRAIDILHAADRFAAEIARMTPIESERQIAGQIVMRQFAKTLGLGVAL